MGGSAVIKVFRAGHYFGEASLADAFAAMKDGDTLRAETGHATIPFVLRMLRGALVDQFGNIWQRPPSHHWALGRLNYVRVDCQRSLGT